MKLDKSILANAFALTTAILWTVCTLFIVLLPDFSMTVLKWWMHGMDVTFMGDWNLSFLNFLLGGLTLTISAWFSGYVFGWSLEKLKS